MSALRPNPLIIEKNGLQSLSYIESITSKENNYDKKVTTSFYFNHDFEFF